MAVATTALAASQVTQTLTSGVKLCHFTTAHAQLKSRSFHRECMPLAAAGMSVRYVSPAAEVGRRDGVEFVRLPERKGRVRQFLSAPVLLRELLHQNASLYHFQDPELLPLAFVLELICGKRVVYDAYEDFPSMAANKQSLPRPLRPILAVIIRGAEYLAAQCFDGLITADPFTLRRLARVGRSKKLVFYNFPNLDFFPPPSRQTPKKFDVVYRGGISDRAGTFVLLEAMRLLANHSCSSISLLLLGYFDNAAAVAAIRERIRTLGLESCVEIRGRIDHESMAEALSQARIGVCPLEAIRKFELNIPVKVFEYWACGLPVVATDLPPIRPFFGRGHAGLLFQPGNAVELAQSIAWLLDHPDAAARMGANGRASVVERFNNKNEVHKLQSFCVQIAGTQARAAAGK